MKKRQQEWKDDDMEDPAELVGVFDDLEGLGEPADDDGIIDLDEIVELTEEAQGEGDEKGDLLDAGGILDFGDVDMDMGGPGKMGLSDEDDFFKDLTFTDADDTIPLADGESLEVKVVDELAETHVGEDDLDFGSLMGFSEETEASGELKDDDSLGGLDGLEALVGLNGDDSSDDVPDDLLGFGDEAAAGLAGATVGVAAGVAGAAALRSKSKEDTNDKRGADSGDPEIEELISLIEGRLVGVVERIVESRLTDIVRTVLREEIERMKRDMGPAEY